MSPVTLWNGEACEAKKVRVVVGKPPSESWWCAKLVGLERDAVRIEYAGHVFYIDNADGEGWFKVTAGQGSPGQPHKSLPVEREV